MGHHGRNVSLISHYSLFLCMFMWWVIPMSLCGVNLREPHPMQHACNNWLHLPECSFTCSMQQITGGGQKVCTSRVVLSVADNFLSGCILPLFCSALGLKFENRGKNIHLKMLSATGRTTLPVHSFCPPPVKCTTVTDCHNKLLFTYLTGYEGLPFCDRWGSHLNSLTKPEVWRTKREGRKVDLIIM